MPILDWLNRDKDVRAADGVPYRLLHGVDELSYGDPASPNMLIQGDNLEALKALLPYYSGQVKCIYIDPPYNTGAAHFEHYDDNLEHSQWLAMMYPRLELLRELLAEDGFICCHIDDAEGQYLKVILDEIFGRDNYLSTLYVQVRYASKTLKSDMSFHKQIEQILVYRKSRAARPYLPSSDGSFEKFKFKIIEKNAGQELVLGNKRVVLFEKEDYEIVEDDDGHVDGLKEIWASGTILDGNSSGRFFRDFLTGRIKQDGLGVLYKVYGIGDDNLGYRYFTGPKKETATKGKYYQGVPQDKRDIAFENQSPIENFYDLSASFGNCRHEGGVEFRSGKKPEKLLKIILDYFSKAGDLVLDSFLGSGSTGATAHKMKRRWIGIEMGGHSQTHCRARLVNVIDGDTTGISNEVGWVGGGGFKYYKLGPTIFDTDGDINPDIRFPHLAAHIWFCETKTAYHPPKEKSPLLGIHNGVAYYLLYNGILGDKSVSGGNVLTNPLLNSLPPHDGPKVIYGETSRITQERLKSLGIVFKQTPYDVKAK